jgi:exopolysaccharide production repressor protein
MSFLLFLRGLIGALVVFAIVTYLVTHSLWTTLIQTVICGVLIQLGYFVAVLYMVWRTPAAGRRGSLDSQENSASKPSAGHENVPIGRRAGVPHVGRSREP